MQNVVSNRPVLVIWLTAILVVAISCFPILFQHKSLLSPNNGTHLFYDHYPTLPNYSSTRIGGVQGADTGAMYWQHFPIAVVQEQSIKKFHEFPLWNRYNSSGTTMIGQGQMMLGDPLNWFTWLIGSNALAFDVKFILLRVIFVVSLGISVFTLTQKMIPAVMVTIFSAFIGFLNYRLNHPDIFTLCYSPLIILSWVKVIYTEKDKNRLWWAIFLLLSNWLVLNSGTVKEAYMSIVFFNIIGVISFVFEKNRFNQRFSAWLWFLILEGLCFLMLATPILGTFLNEIKNGITAYNTPSVYQMPFWQLLGIVDSFYAHASNGWYLPAINIAVFSGLILGLVSVTSREKKDIKKFSAVLAVAIGIILAVIFSIVPASFLKMIPFINNIQHINTTFSLLFIVPACILAGVGFAYLEDHTQKKFIPAIVFMVLLVLYFLNIPNAGIAHKAYKMYCYTGVLLLSSAYLPWLALRFLKNQLSFAAAVLCVLFGLVSLGRGVMFPNITSSPVFQPQDRVNLREEPELISRLFLQTDKNPQRIIGLGDVFMPGYNAALGLEHINGPDAMMDKHYRALMSALKMPYTDWFWRMWFDRVNIRIHKKVLDLLGVGIILSPSKISDDTHITYIADDHLNYAYSRPDAWPRVFYMNRIIPYDSLDTLVHLVHETKHPFIALEKDTVKQNPRLQQLVTESNHQVPVTVHAYDYHLTNNTTGFTINVPLAPGIIYLGEAGNPEDFVVTVNHRIVPCLAANYAFKGILIEEPGIYHVKVRYWPVHFTKYLEIALLGLLLWCLILYKFSKDI